MNGKFIVRFLPLFVLITTLGCGGGEAPGAKVSGKVTHKGAPVAGAQVTFFSAQSKGPEAVASYSATTDESGSFKLGAGNPNWSATPGSYRVAVMKLVAKPGAKLPEPADPEQIIASGLGSHAFPKTYADPNTSPLKADLKEGPNDVILDVLDK